MSFQLYANVLCNRFPPFLNYILRWMVGWQDGLPDLVVSNIIRQLNNGRSLSGILDAGNFRLVCKKWCTDHDSNIRHLALGRSTAIMPVFGRMTSLKSLDLMKMEVATTIRYTASLSNLTSLRLRHCNVSTQALGVVSGLNQLTELGILCCPGVENEGLHRLSSLTKLIRLEITNTITANDFSPLSSLQALRILNLHGCSGISKTGFPEVLSSLTAITQIHLSNCLNSGHNSRVIHMLMHGESDSDGSDDSDEDPDLVEFRVGNTASSISLQTIKTYSRLTFLNLNCAYSVVEVAHLADLHALSSLILTGCYKITNRQLGLLCNAVPGVQSSLKNLSLKSTSLSEEGLVHLAKLTALTSLDLSDLDTPVSLLTLLGFKALTGLQTLNLASNHVRTRRFGHWRIALADLSSISNLNVTGNLMMDDTTLKLLSWRYSSLTSLNLARCNITNAAFEDIASLTTLTSLNISYLNINDSAVQELCMLPALSKLTMIGCSQLSGDGDIWSVEGLAIHV